MGRTSIILTLVWVVVAGVGWSLFFRMIVDLNKVLPPNKRIPFAFLSSRIPEIRRLHEDTFPKSPLSTAWLILMWVAGIVLGTAIVLEVAKTSR